MPIPAKRELAERVGFEPTVEFPLHTLSKRAPSTTRTSLRLSVRLRGECRFGETSRRSPHKSAGAKADGINSLPRSTEPNQADCDVDCDVADEIKPRFWRLSVA